MTSFVAGTPSLRDIVFHTQWCAALSMVAVQWPMFTCKRDGFGFVICGFALTQCGQILCYPRPAGRC